MSRFVSGAELSRRLYEEVVQPILSARFPHLPHSAALLGRGSEVLGFDDEMSTDHDWKPRVLLFIAEEDEPRHGADVRETLHRELPPTFASHPIDCEVYTVRAVVRSGNSGGPIIRPDGKVIGVVFGAALDDSETGFVLTAAQVKPTLERAPMLTRPVDTGSCAA